MLAIASRLGLALSFIAAHGTVLAQQAGDAVEQSSDPRILLRYATFDPLVGTPEVPPALRGGADTNLYIVQFRSTPTDHDRQAVRAAGGVIEGYLPHDCHVVKLPGGAAALMALPRVRWIGSYQPAYRLEGSLLGEHVAGAQIPVRRYNMVMADKRRDKQLLEAKIKAMGGQVFDRHLGGLLFTADLTGGQLLAAVRLDEVLWIDRWSAPEVDMNNARIQGGANAIQTAGGYTGFGIRGHVYEGVQANHPDFTALMTNVRSNGTAQRHGHCTAGIIFGNSTSSPSASGMAPSALGFFTNYDTVSAGWSRNMVIDDVVNVHSCMFTTASWGSTRTPVYTSDSADADDIVFDHGIPWTQSMSNAGNTDARPQAWAKNVISIGGVQHFNNSVSTDDSWLAGNGSIGPAQDGRNKPDLCAYYDSVWTSDLQTGVNNGEGNNNTGGYNTAAGTAGDSFSSFNGTSAATPIVAGHNALAIEMYTDNLFNNPPRVVGGTLFENRPYAQTLKALMIVSADQYTPTAVDNRREHVGWGFPNLNNLWTRRDRFTVIPEDVRITQGSTHIYPVEVLAGETDLKICMTYLDPAGIVAAAIDRVNDLTLQVTSPTGVQYWGNVGLSGAGQSRFSATGGSADTIDTVECVMLQNPTAGTWTIEITAPTITQDAYLTTFATDATYALVVNGGRRIYGSDCARFVPDISTTGPGNYYPWGGYAPDTLTTLFTSGNGGAVGGAVYFDLTVNESLYVTAIDLNTDETVGSDLFADLWITAVGGTHVGNEGNIAIWTPMSALRGVAAGYNSASAMELATPFLLTPGTYGVAVVAGNFRHNYTNGNGANQNYGNASLSLAAGSASNQLGGFVYTPRVANTTIGYRTDSGSATNMRYQTILRQAELGAPGSITGLAFSAQSSGRHWNQSLRVRMSSVSAGYALTSTFDNNLPAPITVLDIDNHSFEFSSNHWREIGLQTAFVYDGVSDVVIDIVARGNWQTASGTFNRGNEQRVFESGWTGSTPMTGSIDNLAARMRVSFNCANANEFGASCGKLVANHGGSGQRNSTFEFKVDNANPNSLAFLSLGLGNYAPFPLSTTAIGWTNCHVWHQNDLIVAVATDAVGVGSYPVTIPNTAANDGLKIFGTWLALDTSEPGNLTISNYTRMIIGLLP